MKQIYDPETGEIKSVFDNVNDLICLLKNTFNFYKEEKDKALQCYHKTKEEIIKGIKDDYSEENAHLKERLKLSYGEFNSEKELNAYLNFKRQHEQCRLSYKINNGRYPYIIPTGTGVGIHYNVICPICGKQQDITDYEAW